MLDLTKLSEICIRLLEALPLTIEIWFLSVSIGAVLAMGLVWMRLSALKPVSWFARGYIFFFRGTPLLIQLYMFYYGLSQFSWINQQPFRTVFGDAFNCSVLSLALCTAAYSSEIFRGALLGVAQGQIEAARACGMSGFMLFRRIIFPVALRRALPAYSTEVISMTKATALVSLVTLWDVMGVADKIRSETFMTYTPLMIAGAIYFIFNLLIAKAFQGVEYYLSPHLRGRST